VKVCNDENQQKRCQNGKGVIEIEERRK